MAENEAAQKAGEAADAAKAAARAQMSAMKTNLGKNSMGDYLSFKALITPSIIQIIFWIGVLFIIVTSILAMSVSFLSGLLSLILGPIFWRLFCEAFIVMFKINDGIQTIVKQGGMSNTFD